MYHALAQDIRIPGKISRDFAASEDGFQHRAVFGKIRADNGNVPPTRTLRHQPQDLSCHCAALMLLVRAAQKPQRLLLTGIRPIATGKQVFSQIRQGLFVLLCRESVYLHFLILQPRPVQEAPCRFPRRLELLAAVAQAVALQADRHPGASIQKLGDDLRLNAVEIRKAVEEEAFSGGKVRVLQRRAQAGQLAVRRLAKMGADCIQALHQEGKFLRLYRQGPGHGCSGLTQAFRGHAEAAKLIEHIQKLQ